MAATAPPLTLDDAIREAFARNADVTASRSHVDPLRAKPDEMRAFAAPSLEAQIWQWPINTLNPANTNMFMLTASQDLGGRGQRAVAAAAARTDIGVAESAVAVHERDVVASVTQAYWDLSIARRAIAIHLETVDLLRNLTDVAQARYAAGRIPQQDVLKAIVETTKLHDDLIGLEQTAERARIRLNSDLNRSIDAPIGALAEPGESTLVASLQDVEALAGQDQPELRMSQSQIDRARGHLAVARSAETPDWSIGAGYMLQPRQTDAWMARLSVTWPGAPWSRGAITARTAEATAAVTAAQADVAADAVRVREAIADAYVRVKGAEQRAALLRTTLVPQSRQALEASRIAYEADRLDFLAVLENERALLDAQLTYDRVLSDWRSAMTDLERAVGATLPAAMLQRVSSTEAR